MHMELTRDTGTPTRIWRPYIDPPLITPEMVHAPDAVADPDRERLRRYLGEFVARRAAPVHTAVAFNAVYFGFDTETGGYAGGPLDIGDFPSVALGDRVEALPVGAMINVRTGGDLLPAEVVYKEGAHPALGGEGDTPGWLSGAPSAARGPGALVQEETSFLHERLVFDDAAFGQGLAATRERLNRLRRRGTIDEYGHLLVESRYVRSEGDLDDTAYYARYLMTRGRDQLISSLAPMPLPLMLPPGTDPQAMETALLGLMRTVGVALGSLPTVRMWGDYAFTRASMAARLADRGPLGRADLEALAQSVARSAVPAGRRRPALRKQVTYTALGPALRALPQVSGLLRTTAYPLAICHANTLLTDYVRREANEESGRLPNGVRLAVDDRWQGGGVWRAEYATGDAPTPAGADQWDEPTGRGWLETIQPEPEPEPEPETGPELPLSEGPGVPDSPGGAGPDGESGTDDGLWWPDDRDVGGLLRQSATEERVEWAQPLRSWHLVSGCFPLPEDVLAGLAPDGASHETVRFRLSHDGHQLPAAQAHHDARLDQEGQLVGLVWPTGFFPGIWLSLAWQRGSREIRAWTTLLPEPETVDGGLVEHRYDRQVLTRDGTDLPHPGRNGTVGGGTDLLVMTAVRRLGLLDIYGRALLPRDRVMPAIRLVMTDVPVHPAPTGVEAALDGLLDDGRLTLERGSQGADGRPHYPSRPGEAALELVCYTPLVVPVRPLVPDRQEPVPVSGRAVKGHHVPGFLRYIGHLGYEASDEQRRLFREDFLTFGLAGSPELPPGYTYVRPHHRGS
ncbi:hypothetical protein ACWCOZ_33235 [Streptomyces sp. NPDC001840]